MTNREFIDTIKVSHGISDDMMPSVNRLLRINVNIRDSIRLLLKYDINMTLIINVLFTLSMYCDYSYERLLEFNELAKDYYIYFGKSGLTLWLYNLIRNENSWEYTLYRNMRVDRVACYMNKVYLENELYDLDLGIVSEDDGNLKGKLKDTGFIWIKENDYKVFMPGEKDKFIKSCDEIKDMLESGEEFKLLVPLFDYKKNRKIAKIVESYIFKNE